MTKRTGYTDEMLELEEANRELRAGLSAANAELSNAHALVALLLTERGGSATISDEALSNADAFTELHAKHDKAMRSTRFWVTHPAQGEVPTGTDASPGASFAHASSTRPMDATRHQAPALVPGAMGWGAE